MLIADVEVYQTTSKTQLTLDLLYKSERKKIQIANHSPALFLFTSHWEHLMRKLLSVDIDTVKSTRRCWRKKV